MNKFISQYTANGSITDFAFTFDIVQGRSVNVYKTLSGSSANEDNDLVATNTYIVALTTPSSELSKGNVIFNVAPENGSIITITPDEKTDVTVSFSNTTPLNQDNLNKAYNQQSSTISQDSENFKVSSLRYNINENKANINYNNKLKPLSDKGFWRREGNNIISQNFISFVEEVSEEVAGSVKNKVNASASNTNLTSKLASNAINTPVSGNIFKVDNDGQVIVDKTLSNVVSSLAGAYWAKEWATSELKVNDDYGNNGFSSKYYATLANIASTATSGLIDELSVYEPTATSKIDLIEYNSNPNEPWIDVLENSFTVYIDGKMIQSPSAYSENGGSTGGTYSYTVDIKQNPTLVSPSSITITPSVPANTQILISRGVAQGDSSTMFATGSNYKTASANSLIANRDLSNVAIGSYPVSSDISVGVSKIATQPIVNAGINNSDTVVPSTLRSLLLKIVEPVGTIIYFYGITPPTNYLAIDGTHWSKNIYSELWAVLQGKSNVSSDATTFWIEDAQEHFIRGVGATNILGAKQGDAIRNITGVVGTIIQSEPPTGAFEYDTTVTILAGSGINTTRAVNFDASRVVPTANENRPVNISYLPCIKFTLGF